MEGIQVSIEKSANHGSISIIRVGGYIDTTTSSELERALDSLLKSGVYYVIIDLGNVDYISSAGWGIFISEIKGIRERGGDLKLARMIPDVNEVFELLEFHYILKSFNSVEDALGDFGIKSDESETDSDDFQPVIEVQEDTNPDEQSSTSDHESVENKIRRIIKANPSFNASKISKELNTEKYEFTKLGTLGVWKLLRRLNIGDQSQQDASTRTDELRE